MAEESSPPVLFSVLLFGSAVKFTFISWLRKKRNEKFEYAGRVHSLYTYPLKSGAGLEIDEADAGVLGLSHMGTVDRHWMVMRRGTLLPERAEAPMKTVSIAPTGDGLRLTAPNMPSLTVDMKKFNRRIKCTLYNTVMDVIDCGDEASSWFETFLQEKDLRLVYSPPHLTKREAVDMKIPWTNTTRRGDLTAFNFLTSYMVASVSSLHDLNQRLKSHVTMRNFRPNIVIEGTPPYDEDNWIELRIGDNVHLRLVDVCTRCLITTVDQTTGLKSPDMEPLKTLKSYRCRKQCGLKPVFGVYCALDIEGPVQVGDPVYILRRTMEN